MNHQHTLSTEEFIRYAQQIKLDGIGISGQDKLKSARVLCVGLGGLGSPMLLYLAAAGVGTLGIVDADVLELSNLQRQVLYRESQLGLHKTEAAKAQLLALNPWIQIYSYNEALSEQNALALLSQYDIIADGSDNFYTRYLIHDRCFELNKPYVYASASAFKAYCSIFYGEKGPCFRCLFPLPPSADDFPDCNAGGVLGVLPGMAGIIQATEIIKWILNIGQSLEKRLLIMDLLHMTFKEIKFSQNPDCSLCVHHEFIHTQPIDWTVYAISIEDLNKRLICNQKITLIDVRSPDAHKHHNIGGKLIPLPELSDRLSELDRNDSIILYCQTDKRSQVALKTLLDAGFRSVRYLSGGVDNILV